MKNKKAMQASSVFMTTTILVVIFLVLAFFIIKSTKEKGDSLRSYAECKSSVSAHIAATKISQGNLAPEIVCPTREVILKTEGEEEAKMEIAKEMKLCNDLFARGREELFPEDGTGIFCHLCSNIKFKKPIELHDFTKFLLKTKVPGTEKTFYEDLKGYSTKNFATEDVSIYEKASGLSSPVDTLDASKGVSVVFVYAKGKDNVKTLGKHLAGKTRAGRAGGAGAVAGTVIGVAGFALGAWPVAIAGVAITIGSEAITYLLSPDNHPEWFSITLATESDYFDIHKLGCTYAPVAESSRKI